MSIIEGDCLDSLTRMDRESVDLIYMDPPFFTQRSQELPGRKGESKYSFEDKWESIDSFAEFLGSRMRECHRILKDSGSIFVHCDKHASHHIRMLLDGVFGTQNFVNEIIWTYKRWSNSKKGLQNCHQTIFLYKKTPLFKFNTIYDEYSATTNVDQILQARERDYTGKSRYKHDENNEIVIGLPKKGVPLGDVWDIPYLNPKARERTGYPTQKPVLLLERIIKIATDEGDIVLDPFCGSGTALVAAKLLNRNYIGMDVSPAAIEISRKRLSRPYKTNSLLLEKGKDGYMNKTERELHILKEFNAVPVQRNKGIDGFLKEPVNGKIVPIKIQSPDESLCEARQKLVKAAESKKCDYMVLIRTKNDTQLFSYQAMDDGKILLVDSPYLRFQELVKIRHADKVSNAGNQNIAP